MTFPTYAPARPWRPPDPPNETAAREREFTAAAGRHSREKAVMLLMVARSPVGHTLVR